MIEPEIGIGTSMTCSQQIDTIDTTFKIYDFRRQGKIKAGNINVIII